MQPPLATIEPSRVAPEVRPKLERYQVDCARVLRNHFFGSNSPARTSSDGGAKEEVSRPVPPALTEGMLGLERGRFLREAADRIRQCTGRGFVALELEAVETALGRPLPAGVREAFAAMGPSEEDVRRREGEETRQRIIELGKEIMREVAWADPPLTAAGLLLMRTGDARWEAEQVLGVLLKGGVVLERTGGALRLARTPSWAPTQQEAPQEPACAASFSGRLAAAIRAQLLAEVETAPAPITSWSDLAGRVRLGSSSERWQVLRALMREGLLAERAGQIVLGQTGASQLGGNLPPSCPVPEAP